MDILINSNTYGSKLCSIDDEDYVKIKDYTWCVGKNHSGFYAMSRIKICHGKYQTLRMHHMFMVTDKFIDHIDGNGLNNMKDNLRPATALQNGYNVGVTSRNKTGFKGVYKRWSKYIASIRIEGRLIELGRFSTAVQAAECYNEAAKQYFGEFAWLNPL